MRIGHIHYHDCSQEKEISGLDYKSAGVNIDAGNALVNAIKPLAKSTTRAGVMEDLGGFGALFDLKDAGFRDPVLVAATDGVGTKLKIALDAGIHDTVGIDLVAMCVNDLVVQGAEPLLFLDYFATGKLDVETATDVVKGIAEGCKQAGCALIGGETAELPGMYQGNDYDLAGFALGAVERNKIIDGSQIRKGDVILGLASNGLHSNGFSLVRKVVEGSHMVFADPSPFDDDEQTFAEALLSPTRIYVKSCLAAAKAGKVAGFAHITGGGLFENIPRVLPDELGAVLDMTAWTVPEIFLWLAEHGKIEPEEMARAFNCGVGMAVIVGPKDAEAVSAVLTENGETVCTIGEITASAEDDTERRVTIKNLEDPWR